MISKDPFSGLKPAVLWNHFAEITKIPRPGGQEAAVAEWLANWAEEHDFSHRLDSAGNICIYVPASDGLSESSTIALQGHLDMVCVAAENSASDPSAGKIDIVRDGDWIVAPESTLGADNGIGIAATMCLVEDNHVSHGPLELLFTVEEETTFKGAIELDPSLITAKMMINLDWADDNISLVIASAGVNTSLIKWPLPAENIPDDWVVYRIYLKGLKGGHSGVDIEKNRLNGIKGIVWLIQKIKGKIPVCLCELSGGDAKNAIPIHGRATIAIPPTGIQQFFKIVNSAADDLASRYSLTDPNLTLSVEKVDDQDIPCWSDDQRDQLIDLLSVLPSGVIAMEQTSPHLVETSNNLGVLKVRDNTLGIVCLTRSSVLDAHEQVVAAIESAARLAGAEFVPPKYPPSPWRIPEDSALLSITQAAYQDLFQKEIPLVTTHAGLECATIQEHFPDMDVISLGPVIQDCHKPGERVSISSVLKFYEHLCLIIRKLSG